MNQGPAAGLVLWTFLKLGLSSFGGPLAHLGYFRREFVEKRHWVTAEDYTSILAMCQFMPGPASSQVGFCIGLRRAGWLGGLAAFTGFTLPSFILMVALAYWINTFETVPMAAGALHGLQLAAMAVVAQAVWIMARSLCPDTPRRGLAILAAAIMVQVPGTYGQILVLLIGAAIGRIALEPAPASAAKPAALSPIGQRRAGTAALAAFIVLMVLTILAPGSGILGLFAAFFRAGALVFGGGHVVLPTLRDAIVAPGWVSPQLFLAGYGAAQAMPGPLFTVAAYLGTVATAGPGGLAGAAIATIGIFMPGLLLAGGFLPFWQILQHQPAADTMMKGVNAAVVGLLGAAFINLLSLTANQSFLDGPIILAALALLTLGKARPILVVLFCAVAGAFIK
jgi:chromate transporter